MADRRAVTVRAKVLGTTARYHEDRDGQSHEVTIEAPDGKVWKSSGVHQLVMAGSDGTPWHELYSDALERMEGGVEDCDDPDCDVCHA